MPSVALKVCRTGDRHCTLCTECWSNNTNRKTEVLGGGAGFSATLSIINLTWAGTGLNASHWTDRPVSNILSHGIARFIMLLDDRT
jgi:hypothetical protein